MAALRKSLHWIATATAAALTPVFSLAAFGAGAVRARRRKATVIVLPSDGVVAFAPRADAKRKADAPRPKDGAVILAFPKRAISESTAIEAPARTGSR